MPARAKKSAKKRTNVEVTVTRDAFRSDPAGAFDRIARGGRVVITDANGTPVAILSAPSRRITLQHA